MYKTVCHWSDREHILGLRTPSFKHRFWNEQQYYIQLPQLRMPTSFNAHCATLLMLSSQEAAASRASASPKAESTNPAAALPRSPYSASLLSSRSTCGGG